MSGGRIPAAVIDRWTTGSNPGTMDRNVPRVNHWAPPEMEMANCCRSFLMSRLKAAELMNQQLSDDARSATNSRLRTARPPGEFNVDLAIEQLRAQVASLLDADIGVIRQLLTVNEQIEEMKWQRKFGSGDGSPWTPSTYMSGSCTADIDSVDLDPYMDPGNPPFNTDSDLRDPRHDDVRRHVINGCYNDDVTDDVFHNDETAAVRVPLRANDASLSNEVRLKVTPSGLKVNSLDNEKGKVNRSKVEFMVKDPKNADDSKTAKVEFRVNSNKVTSSDAELKVKGQGLDGINDKLKTAKVEFKVDSAKGVDTKPPNSQVEVRFLINSNDARSQGHSVVEGHSRRIAAEPPFQTGTADSSLLVSHDVKPMLATSGPIRKQQNPNDANRETKLERRSQLRIVNVGQGYRSGQAGIKTPGRLIEAPFLAASENEASETVVVHL